MVGDDPYTDIYGAKRFGAITFQKIHKGVALGSGDQTPDYSFVKFIEFYDLVRKLL